MVQYDDASYLYDVESLLYDGLTISEGVNLLIDGALVDKSIIRPTSLRVRVTDGSFGTQGNIDFTLVNPGSVPELDTEVHLFYQLQSVYVGLVREVEVEALPGAGITMVSVSGMDDGGSASGVPSTAPFDLSDDSDGMSTMGYVSVVKRSRTTEELGLERTNYEVVTDHPGLMPGMNVHLTNDLLGLSDEELAVNDVSIQWRGPLEDVLRYTIQLGDPVVKLHQVIGQVLPDSSITETKIADDAISTPKLQANSVVAEKIAAGAIEADQIAAGAVETEKLAADAIIAHVLNVDETVEINDSGIAIVSGGITVTNPSAVVIIDGTSNMFKIIASGTVSSTEPTGNAGVVSFNDLPGLGTWTTIPVAITTCSFSNSLNSTRQLGRDITFAALFGSNISGGSPTSKFNSPQVEGSACSVVRTATSYASIQVNLTNYSGGSKTFYARYHLCQEAAL